jgi:hypothetical protein
MTKQAQATGEKPTHRLYIVSGTGRTASWREIGAAWPNRDGEGYSVTCNAMPLTGRIVMRTITERRQDVQAS